jgi:YHS domain-containing protein
MKLFALAVLVLLSAVGCARDHDDTYGDKRDSNSRAPSEAARVQDPVCGMWCEKNTSRVYVHNDTTYYFCSDECRTKFKQNPDSYIASR